MKTSLLSILLFGVQSSFAQSPPPSVQSPVPATQAQSITPLDTPRPPTAIPAAKIPNVREQTLQDDISLPREHPHSFGRNSSLYGYGVFWGTIVESDVGQETLAGVQTRDGLRFLLDHVRLPNESDLMRGGIVTPSVRGFALQSAAETTTEQDYANAQGLLLFEPTLNAIVRGGIVHYEQENFALFGGQYLGTRLGGFILNADAVGNTEELGANGFMGLNHNGWYASVGGNTTGQATSSQGIMAGNRSWGGFNQIRYNHDGEQGFKIIVSPDFTMEGDDAMDFDQRLTDVGKLWILKGWSRFDPNYANGRFLFALNADRNTQTDTWHAGGMFYDQMDREGRGVENYFWGIGLARARADDCRGWRVILDQAAPFPYLSERVTVQVDPEDYEFNVTLWLGSHAK